MKTAWLTVLLVLFLLLPLGPTPPGSVHALPSDVSRVYVTPGSICCQFNQSSFTVNVMLDLAAGQAVNVIDVRLNYSSFWSIYTNRSGTIQAEHNSISYSGNIFGSSNDIIFECIDAVAGPGQRCSSDDGTAGQVHISADGNLVTGPLTGLLFSVGFSVHGNGTSIFTFDRADIVNPTIDPNNPVLLNPHSIKRIASAAIFGNKGLVAFFNYEPATSQAILPGEQISFDASYSINGTTGTALNQPRFSWNFGDKTTVTNLTSAVTQHSFKVAGTYQVQLNVTEANGGFGSITRKVVVVPAVGSISLIVRDARGSVIIGGIIVQIFNTSLTTSFMNKTIALSGQANFTNLTPADYVLKFAGFGYQNQSKTETVEAGWTTVDNIYLLSVPTPPQNITGLIVITAVVLGGAAMGGLGLFVRRRRERSLKNAPRISPPKSKTRTRLANRALAEFSIAQHAS